MIENTYVDRITYNCLDSNSDTNNENNNRCNATLTTSPETCPMLSTITATSTPPNCAATSNNEKATISSQVELIMSLEGRTLHDIMTNENENDETKRTFEKSLQVYLQTSVETACPLPTDECPAAGNRKHTVAFTFTDVTIAEQDFVVFDTSDVA